MSALFIQLLLSHHQNLIKERSIEQALYAGLAIRLEQSMAESAAAAALNPGIWKQHNDNVRQALDTLQLIKKYNLTPSFVEHPRWSELASNFTSLQGRILSHQNELMKLRASREALSYRIDTTLASLQLIIDSLLNSSDQADSIKPALQLKDNLLDIRESVRHFWFAEADQASVYRKLTEKRNSAQEISRELISGQVALTTPAMRREMLAVTESLTQMNDQISGLDEARSMLSELNALQHQANSQARQALDLINTIDQQAGPVRGILLLLLAIPGIWIVLVIYLTSRPAGLAERPSGQQQAGSALTFSDQDSRSSPFDPEPLLYALEQAAKGNMGYRMNDRDLPSRDIAAAYNQMMSSLYRKLVDMYRLIHAASAELTPSGQADGKSRETGEPNVANPLETRGKTDLRKSEIQRLLNEVIKFSLSIAATSDQLSRRVTQGASRPAQLPTSLHPLVEQLEKDQALIRAYARDCLDYLSSVINEASLTEDGKRSKGAAGKDIASIRTAIEELTEHFRFFRLDKRI